jgi:tight adherence protein C
MMIQMFLAELAIPAPVLLTSVAIFFAVTAVSWVAIGRVSGEDRPRAESRLDVLKDPRKRVSEIAEEEKQQSKNAALTAALERAATPSPIRSVAPKPKSESSAKS